MIISDVVLLIFFIVLLVLIVGVHLVKSFSIGKRSTWPKSLLQLLGLSLLITIIWHGLGLLIFAVGAMSSETPSWTRIFFFTFGLPFYLNIEFFLPIILFILGLPALVLGKKRVA